MAQDERTSALEIALNNEMKEHEYYLSHAERTTNPLGQAMFKQIAAEELEHYERLKELHQRWTREEKWPETVPLAVKDTAIKDALEAVVQKVAELPAGDDDDLKAIQVAIEFESRGTAFYENLRDQSEDPKEKAFFNLLAQIEREHHLYLVKAEGFLRDPASWYTLMEHPTMDGA